jgi:hypothetical protein
MMQNQNVRVMPIQRDLPISDPDKTLAGLAYNLWLSSAFRGDSPEQALLAALQMIKAKAPAKLLVLPKRER